MATDIIFLDGVTHNSTATVKWPETTSDPTIATGVTGAHGRVYDLASNNLIRNLGQNLQNLACGARWQFRINSTQDIMLFRDTASNTQVKVRYVTGGSFDILRNTTVLDSTAAGLVSLNTPYYIEMGAKIDNTIGVVTCKIYDDTLTLLDTLTFSGDTQNTANAFANHVILAGSACDAYVEDIWIADSSTLYGPLRIETVYPTGNGSLVQWTRGGADSGANWSQLDEAQDNGSTDYLHEVSNGNVNLCTFPGRSLTGTAIHAVQVTMVAQRSAAVGGITFRARVKVDGSTYNGATQALLNNYIAFVECWGVSPDSGIGWVDSEFAGFEAGAEKIAGAGGVDVNLTQLVLEIAAEV